ncbi:phosphohydrolase [Spirochaetia bacterium]|nr:phosphohydrolase [Spirochaetia bacterium]
MKDAALFENFAAEILTSGKFAESRGYIQHGSISVYEHSLEVARLSFSMGELFKIADMKSLVRAALLHDFFCYDWHRPEKMWSLHGWTHPVVAAENGRTEFNISDKEASLIRTHMWPYTLLHPPKYREGWIICLADKVCSLSETVCRWRKPKLCIPVKE